MTCLAAEIEALVAEGAATFDPHGLRLISRLADAGLETRAQCRIEKLSRELREAREESESLIARLKLREARITADIAGAMANSDYRLARRLAFNALRDAARSKPSAVPRWALSIATKARARAVRLPQDLALRVDAFVGRPDSEMALDSETRLLANEMSRALFDDSIATTRATIAVARATDNVPESAGPYNTHALAAQALFALANLSPHYLRSYVAMLDDLAALEPLKAADSKSTAPPRRRRA